METNKKNRWWILGGFLVYSIALSLFFHREGKNACEEAHQTKIEINKKTLENHEAKLDTIKNESRDAAVERFHKDNVPE